MDIARDEYFALPEDDGALANDHDQLAKDPDFTHWVKQRGKEAQADMDRRAIEWADKDCPKQGK